MSDFWYGFATLFLIGGFVFIPFAAFLVGPSWIVGFLASRLAASAEDLAKEAEK